MEMHAVYVLERNHVYCNQRTVIVAILEKKVKWKYYAFTERTQYKAMLIEKYMYVVFVAFLYWAGPIAGPDTGAHMLAAAIALLLQTSVPIETPRMVEKWKFNVNAHRS